MLLLLDSLPRHPPPAASDPQLQSLGACAGLHPGLPWAGQGMHRQDQSSHKSSVDTPVSRPHFSFSSLQQWVTGLPPGPQDLQLSLLDPAFSLRTSFSAHGPRGLTGSSVLAHLPQCNSFALFVPLPDTVPHRVGKKFIHKVILIFSL